MKLVMSKDDFYDSKRLTMYTCLCPSCGAEECQIVSFFSTILENKNRVVGRVYQHF